jgi:transglutaminase-like putative cysteine protease
MRRTWEERFRFEVQAVSVEEALLKANKEQDDITFNWNNVEQSDHEVMFVNDAHGAQVYSLDAEADTDEACSAHE